MMDPNDLSWQEKVQKKLAKVFANEQENFIRILFFLDEEDKAYKDNPIRPYAPQWRSLKATLENDKAFEMFARRLSDDTKIANNDQKFRQRMNAVYEQMMSHCDETVELDEVQMLQIERLVNEKHSVSAFGGLARALGKLNSQSQIAVIDCIRAIANPRTMTVVDNLARQVNRMGGTVVMVGLAAVQLGYLAIVNIRRWWKGEISGKRCLKNLLDATFTVVAGVGGGVGGAAVGTAICPGIGTVVGGVVGGYVSAALVSAFFDRLTQSLFGLPKDEALENAYNFLGVKMTASNAEVNTAYRKSCLQYHPDRGGEVADFLELQCHMTAIKLARGESFI